MCDNSDWKSLISTHPAKWHDVKSVAAAIDFIKEVTVGEMRCIVYLQLIARIPEGVKEMGSKNGPSQQHLSTQ